jgi:PAS domain S-box-containing protein
MAEPRTGPRLDVDFGKDLLGSSSFLWSVFEAAAQAIFIVDQPGRIRMANPATEKMFGFDAAELLGQSVDMLLPEHLRAGHAAHRTQYFNKPQTRPMGLGMDLQARRKDGTMFYAEISLSHVDSAQGTLAVAFVTDISKRRTDEEAIRQQREELQLLAGKLLTAQDEERRRIARDLHDDLSQTLASLAIDLGRHANKAAAGETTSHLRQLQERATKAAESVRRISHRLHSSVLDDIGLVAALEQFCEEFQERSGIRTEFASQDVPDRLPLAIASSVYNIAQECLHNVSKHSRTSAVAVRLEQVNAALRLSVKDGGVGFRLGTTGSGKGIGIGTMQERARLLQGRFSIWSEPGAGTEVRVDVPLEQAP